MSKNVNPKKTSLIVLILIVCVPVALLVLPFIAVIGGLVLSMFTQISEQEANKKCDAFYNNVKADIQTVQGVVIDSSNKTCTPSKDELGGTDYYFTGNFKVKKSNIYTVEAIKTDINSIAKSYPSADYHAMIDNISTAEGRPIAICISANTQVQENGRVYNSTPPEVMHRYIDYVTEKSFVSGCSRI